MSHEFELCLILGWGVVVGYLLGKYEGPLAGVLCAYLDGLRDRLERANRDTGPADKDD